MKWWEMCISYGFLPRNGVGKTMPNKQEQLKEKKDLQQSIKWDTALTFNSSLPTQDQYMYY